MNKKQRSILVLLLLAWAGLAYAQTPKPQLTRIQNPYKEMRGMYTKSPTADFNEPIVYKDKLYMAYYHQEAHKNSLVSFDGTNWDASIYKDENGKLVGTRYSYEGEATIFKGLLFMKFRDTEHNQDIVRYTDGKEIKTLYLGIKRVYSLLATENMLYVATSRDGDVYLYGWDGEDIQSVNKLPDDADYYTWVHYKGKLRFVGDNKIYTLSDYSRFSSLKVTGIQAHKPVLWRGELCYSTLRPLKEPCEDGDGNAQTKGKKIITFDGEKMKLLYNLAKDHYTVLLLHSTTVIDGNLYSRQLKCGTDNKASFTVNRGNARASAYTYAASCDGDFIKYQNSILVRYKYENGGNIDRFLTKWTFDSNNKLTFERIQDDYIYINGEPTKVDVSYWRYPIVFKNELYLCYRSQKGGKRYLMKYTP